MLAVFDCLVLLSSVLLLALPAVINMMNKRSTIFQSYVQNYIGSHFPLAVPLRSPGQVYVHLNSFGCQEVHHCLLAFRCCHLVLIEEHDNSAESLPHARSVIVHG